MTEEQKSFILDKLIPFVLRDQGKGFNMDYWKACVEDDEPDAPQCGIVACLGGSIEILTSGETTFDVTGLSQLQLRALFYGWLGNDPNYGFWPAQSVAAYREAKTKLARAEVACNLLREIVRTDGSCLILAEVKP